MTTCRYSKVIWLLTGTPSPRVRNRLMVPGACARGTTHLITLEFITTAGTSKSPKHRCTQRAHCPAERSTSPALSVQSEPGGERGDGLSGSGGEVGRLQGHRRRRNGTGRGAAARAARAALPTHTHPQQWPGAPSHTHTHHTNPPPQKNNNTSTHRR